MEKTKKYVFCVLCWLVPLLAGAQKTVEYDLYVQDTLVNLLAELLNPRIYV